MSLLAGSVSIVGGKPTYTGEVARTNVCVNFNSTGSGAGFIWENVNFAYWDTVFRTKVEEGEESSVNSNYNAKKVRRDGIRPMLA